MPSAPPMSPARCQHAASQTLQTNADACTPSHALGSLVEPVHSAPQRAIYTAPDKHTSLGARLAAARELVQRVVVSCDVVCHDRSQALRLVGVIVAVLQA